MIFKSPYERCSRTTSAVWVPRPCREEKGCMHGNGGQMAKTTTGTPFPWLPMLAIAVGLLSHFYALTSLFPYAGYMVQSLGVTTDKDEAGQSLLDYPLCSVRLCIYLSTLRLPLQRKERGKGKDGAQLGRRASASSNHGSTRVPPSCLCAPSYICTSTHLFDENVYTTTANRLLRRLYCVCVHGRSGRGLVLLGPLRRPVRAATCFLHRAGLHGGSVDRVRPIYHLCVGPRLPVSVFKRLPQFCGDTNQWVSRGDVHQSIRRSIGVTIIACSHT